MKNFQSPRTGISDSDATRNKDWPALKNSRVVGQSLGGVYCREKKKREEEERRGIRTRKEEEEAAETVE